MNKLNEIQNVGHFKFSVGELTLWVISDGSFKMDSVQPVFAPNVDTNLVSDFLTSNFYPSDIVNFAGNLLVIKKEDRMILCDTGSGTQIFDTAGRLLPNLKSAGIEESDITDIILTHAHVDHIGGLLHADGSLAFEKANVYIAKEEYAFWMSENPDFSKGSINETTQFGIDFAKKHLSTIDSNRLHFFENEDVILDCLRIEISPGHTPGHTIITVFSNNEELVHIADTFQHILLLAHPEWGSLIDTDYEKAIASRKELGTRWTRNKTLLFGDHLPYPGLGYIKQLENGFQWIPRAIFSPEN